MDGGSAHVAFEDLDAETRTIGELDAASAGVGEESSDTGHQFGWSLGPARAPVVQPLQSSSGTERAEIPADWRMRMATPQHLNGAGLTLYSLRERGVVGREA